MGQTVLGTPRDTLSTRQTRNNKTRRNAGTPVASQRPTTTSHPFQWYSTTMLGTTDGNMVSIVLQLHAIVWGTRSLRELCGTKAQCGTLFPGGAGTKPHRRSLCKTLQRKEPQTVTLQVLTPLDPKENESFPRTRHGRLCHVPERPTHTNLGLQVSRVSGLARLYHSLVGECSIEASMSVIAGGRHPCHVDWRSMVRESSFGFPREGPNLVAFQSLTIAKGMTYYVAHKVIIFCQDCQRIVLITEQNTSVEDRESPRIVN